MTRPMVARVIRAVADERGWDFNQAAAFLAQRWENAAMEAKRNGYLTWRIWDEMGMMALEIGEDDD